MQIKVSKFHFTFSCDSYFSINNTCACDRLLSKDAYDTSMSFSGAYIKTHSHVSASKKTKKCIAHKCVYMLFSIIKSLNSVFHISKTTEAISTKFIYFLPYIYTTNSHIKIEGSYYSISQFSLSQNYKSNPSK